METNYYNAGVYTYKRIEELEEKYKEVLDALILTNISLSYIQGGKPGKLYLNNIAVIEKATGENGRFLNDKYNTFIYNNNNVGLCYYGMVYGLCPV